MNLGNFQKTIENYFCLIYIIEYNIY